MLLLLLHTTYDLLVLSQAVINPPTVLLAFRYDRSPDWFNDKTELHKPHVIMQNRATRTLLELSCNRHLSISYCIKFC